MSFVQVQQHAAVLGSNRQTYDDVRDPPGHGFVPQRTPGSTVTRAVSQHFKKNVSTSKYGKFGSPYLGKAQQPQDQRFPFLSVCAVFSSVRTTV